MTVHIREVQDQYLPALVDLSRQLSGGGSPQLTVDQARSRLRRISAYPNFTIYVATLGDAVVGTFALLLMGNIGNGGCPSGVVEDVVVGAEHRGQGIGQLMMNHTLELCSRAACYKLTLSSNLQREAAHGFYESLGFVKHAIASE